MLRTLCQADPILEKLRHSVRFAGLDWTFDVYLGSLAGTSFAEVELTHPHQHLELPRWVGEEVTNNPRFRKRALVGRLKPKMGQGSIEPAFSGPIATPTAPSREIDDRSTNSTTLPRWCDDDALRLSYRRSTLIAIR